MDWIKVKIYTTSLGIEPVMGRLLQIGIDGIEIEDEADFKDFLENNREYWDYVDDDLVKEKSGETCVITYIEASNPDALAAIRAEMAELADSDKDKLFGRLAVRTDTIREEDWANTWKQYFHTMDIGENITVKPYWKTVEDNGRTVFEINPGLTFGTGSHHTTRLCIEEIEKTVKDGDTVLDLGCGSGILSVMALMLGAKSAVAVDIDKNSEETAYDNLERNGIPRDRYDVHIGNILTDTELKKTVLAQKYDIVLANIVADVIIASLPFVKSALKPNGTFITSGIIEDRIEDVVNALTENGFEILYENRSADWAEFKCKVK